MHPFFVFVTLVVALWAEGSRKPVAPALAPKLVPLPPRATVVIQNGVWYTVH